MACVSVLMYQSPCPVAWLMHIPTTQMIIPISIIFICPSFLKVISLCSKYCFWPFVACFVVPIVKLSVRNAKHAHNYNIAMTAGMSPLVCLVRSLSYISHCLSFHKYPCCRKREPRRCAIRDSSSRHNVTSKLPILFLFRGGL